MCLNNKNQRVKERTEAEVKPSPDSLCVCVSVCVSVSVYVSVCVYLILSFCPSLPLSPSLFPTDPGPAYVSHPQVPHTPVLYPSLGFLTQGST